MAEMVLAGPDGKPAIDASTGMPATMEELLRRRGLVSVNGNVSLANQMGGTPSGGVPPAVAASTAPSNAPSAADIAGAPDVSTALAQSGGPMQMTPEQLSQQQDANGSSDSDVEGMLAAGLITLAGGAGAYTLWRKLRQAKQGVVPPGMRPGGVIDEAGAMGGGSNLPVDPRSPIIEGEFNEVPRALPAPAQQLGAPQAGPSLLEQNQARAIARQRMSNAAQAAPSGTPIQMAPPVARQAESPVAGIARTLGMDPAVLQQLLKNKGLQRTLGRSIP